MTDHRSGKVYLVGAGPGDPKLITVRGVELLARADVIVNDRLASPRLLQHARSYAEIIYAGKASRDHHLTQDEIIRVIIEHAKMGKTVVRLKGGDPFVFGRGGEEAVALVEAGIDFEIVPGVSSAVAVPAYAGIPVTSRAQAVSFGVITGHETPDKSDSGIKWDKIATGLDTLVFLMGVENLPNIVRELTANGRNSDTPVALVRWGTHPKQQTLVGTLADIVEKCQAANFTAPAVTVVGDVVNLRETISWFEKKPLFGKRIIVTRAETQASALTEQLIELGADVDEFPVIKFIAPDDYSALDAAIGNIGHFDWLIFTSANGVEWFVKRLMDTGRDVRAMAGPKLAAIGPKTAMALTELKLKVDYVPSRYVAESVVAEFPEDAAGKSILIVRAQEAREELPQGLRERGADVQVVAAYRTITNTDHAEALQTRLQSGGVDIITFTSASTVKKFFSLIGDARVPGTAIIACIGPITAQAARDHGLVPTIVAEEYTIDGLVDGLVLGG